MKLQHIFENSEKGIFLLHWLFSTTQTFLSKITTQQLTVSQWSWDNEFWTGIYFGINFNTVWNSYIQSKQWKLSLKRIVSDVSQEPNSSVSICNICLQIFCLSFSNHFKRNFRSPLSACFNCWAHQPTLCRIPSIHLPIYLSSSSPSSGRALSIRSITFSKTGLEKEGRES